MKFIHAASRQAAAALGKAGALEIVAPVTGGDINRAFQARLGKERLFVKLNRPSGAAMLAAEFDSLRILREQQRLRVPKPVCHGADDEFSWLVMEYVDLQRTGDHVALGRGLARMHQQAGSQFGWSADNFIGTTPQPNLPSRSWCAFWWDQRLGHQLELAFRGGDPHGLAELYRPLEQAVKRILAGHRPIPSLLHGDLWGGNYGFDAAGQPVLFDPACYHGDRETDLAMAELFGGFTAEFHAAYRDEWPLEEGYAERRTLYQLYHVLNHLNLFGAGWLGRVRATARELIEATN